MENKQPPSYDEIQGAPQIGKYHHIYTWDINLNNQIY